MTFMLEQQSEAFFVCVVSGIIIGLFIEIFIALKKAISINKVVLGIADIVFWLALCVIIIWATFSYNSGQVRFYIFLGFFSGIGIYFSTINWVVSKVLNYILYWAKLGFKKVIFGVKKLVDIICSRR